MTMNGNKTTAAARASSRWANGCWGWWRYAQANSCGDVFTVALSGALIQATDSLQRQRNQSRRGQRDECMAEMQALNDQQSVASVSGLLCN